MAVAVDAPASPPPGLTPKGRRALLRLEVHEQRMERNAAALLRWECGDCGGLIGKYEPPIRRFEEPCRKCGAYNVLTTEPVASAP